MIEHNNPAAVQKAAVELYNALYTVPRPHRGETIEAIIKQLRAMYDYTLTKA